MAILAYKYPYKFLLFFLLLMGCQTSYILKSGYYQAQLIRNRVPNDEILKNASVDEETKRKIRLIQYVRKFSEEQLGLTPTQNYTSYVKIQGDYVTYIVQASPQYELEHYLWHYPFLGSLPYKGFFEKEDALDEAKKLKSQGYDTMVRGVRAYSTLGWLKDPILSSMMNYKDPELVNLIIHESTHSTLYIKSSADFNEQLAVFVANVGTELFYKHKEGDNSPTLKEVSVTNQDEKKFSKFITQEIKKLKEWYVKNPQLHTPSEKQKRLDDIKNNLKKIESTFSKDSYHYFKNADINNAVLMGYKTYSEDDEIFEKAFLSVNKNIKSFIKLCQSLKASDHPKSDLIHALNP